MKHNYEQALTCFENIGDEKMCQELKGKIKVKEA